MSDNASKREIHKLAIASDGVNKPLEARFCNGDPIMTIHPDGRITVSDKLKPGEIAATVLEMMNEQWLANPQAKLIRELQERIKRLEEAGDELAKWADRNTPVTILNDWTRAKEAKP